MPSPSSYPTAPPLHVHADLHLPIISFDGRGVLVGLTEAAAGLLGIATVEGQLPVLSVAELLRGTGANGSEAANGVWRLEELVERSGALAWGESVVMEYRMRVGGDGRSTKAEVLAASSSVGDGEEKVYSILFLRPALDNHLDLTSPIPTADATATSSPTKPPPPIQSPSSSSLETVSSSASTASSARRKAGRPLVGDERGRVEVAPVLQTTFHRLTSPLWSAPPTASSSPNVPPSTATPSARPTSTRSQMHEAATSMLPGPWSPRPTPPLETLFACLDTLPTIPFISNPQSQILHVNKAWHVYCGTEREGVVPEEVWLYHHHPEDLLESFNIYQAAIAAKTSYTIHYRLRTKDGIWRWNLLQGKPVLGDDGEVTHYVSSVTDVDDLISTKHQAVLDNLRTTAIIEASSLLLLNVDVKGKIDFCEGLRSSFLPPDKATAPVLGRSLTEVWDHGDLHSAVNAVLDGEKSTVDVETTTGTAESQRFHRYRCVPLKGDPSIRSDNVDSDAVTGVIVVGRETTELVLAEKRLEKSRAEKAQLQASELAAQEANRLKTEFLTTVSHEIRTPIASILGICELLLGDQISDEQRQLVTKAIQSGENLLELVGTVLDVRKVETGELQLEQAPFHISDIVDDARVFKVAAEKKGLSFVEDVQPYFGDLVLADRLRLRQILANALSNAVKFTNEGSVSLHLRQLEETDSSVTVEFIVEDTGVGISPDVLPTLFVPFRQADTSTARQFGGSGLGLTIAHKLVELMGGTVDLTSPGTGLGSRMTVIVPLTKAPPPLPSPPVPTSPVVYSQSGSPELPTPLAATLVERSRKPEEVKVLLAEDNALIREIVTKTLRKMKFSIFAVKDGRECVERVEKDDYDVILMDGQMPIMDGYAATAAIRKHSNPRIRTIRIIALTASAIAGDMERCLESGMDSYLAKPVRAKELEAAIWAQVEIAQPPAPCG